jgi:hypothetical protein
MSGMPVAVLSERPPESKVMPLPTRARVSGLPRRARALVRGAMLEDDQARRVGAALADREDGAHALAGHLGDVEHAAREADLPGDPPGLAGQRVGEEDVRRLVREVPGDDLAARDLDRLGDPAPERRERAGRADVDDVEAAGFRRLLLAGLAGVLGRAGQIAVEAIGPEDRALGDQAGGTVRRQLTRRRHDERDAIGARALELPADMAAELAQALVVEGLGLAEAEQDAAHQGAVPRAVPGSVDDEPVTGVRLEVAAGQRVREPARQSPVQGSEPLGQVDGRFAAAECRNDHGFGPNLIDPAGFELDSHGLQTASPLDSAAPTISSRCPGVDSRLRVASRPERPRGIAWPPERGRGQSWGRPVFIELHSRSTSYDRNRRRERRHQRRIDCGGSTATAAATSTATEPSPSRPPSRSPSDSPSILQSRKARGETP